jgi:glycosyltransferase involved in cell wall biosynthesis
MTTDVACFNGYPSTSFAPHIRATQKVLIAREVLRTDTPLFDRYAKMLRRTIHKAVAIGPVELAQLRMIGINAEMVFNSAKNPPAFSPIKTAPPLHFGCFGKLYPDKGQDLLVIACAAIKDHLRKYNAHMHIYGNGDKLFLASINSIVQKKRLQDLVSFHGWVEDVESQISNMHCIVRPDRTGSPWGRDVIEAMSIGRPVLASGSEEIFIQDDHTGWLFRPDDPAHLAQKILNLCTIPQCLAVAGKTAFDFACINFDPETNARRIERIFLET